MSKLSSWTVSKSIARRRRQGEEGQGLVEYGLILALVSVLCIAALQGLQGGLSGTLDSVTARL